MDLVTFLFFILSGIGITNLIVNSSIFSGIRDYIKGKSKFFGELISCMMCSGFWVGVLMSSNFGYEVLYGGALISVMSYTYGVIIEYIEILSANYLTKFTEEDE